MGFSDFLMFLLLAKTIFYTFTLIRFLNFLLAKLQYKRPIYVHIHFGKIIIECSSYCCSMILIFSVATPIVEVVLPVVWTLHSHLLVPSRTAFSPASRCSSCWLSDTLNTVLQPTHVYTQHQQQLVFTIFKEIS